MQVLTRTELVGRDSELNALRELLAEARRGHPRLVLCHGEPGIGKTRLGEELVARASAGGAVAAWGSGTDSPGAPPYWPWRQVLRVFAGPIDLVAIARQHGLTRDLAGVAADVFAPPGGVGDGPTSAEDRFRQFDAVARLLRQASIEAPLLVVLDDIHWADAPSVLLLQHVARGLTDERLLLMVNSRDTEHQHRAVLTGLLREPVSRLLHLGGLSRDGVRRQLAQVLGADPQDEQVDDVLSVTGGNPFLVREMGRLLADHGGGRRPSAVTPTIRDSIAARLDRLSAPCVRFLGAAAVLGTEFPVYLARAMAGLDLDNCLTVLDEAIDAGLVESGPPSPRRRFVHALVRDAIEAGLGTAERVRLHRAAAEAMERQGTPFGAVLFDLAGHLAVAAVGGNDARAALWIQRAGSEAMRQRAYEDAARLFAQALQVGGAAIDQEGRCRLLLDAAAAANLAADFGACLDYCLEAAGLAREMGRPDLLAEAALVVDPGGHAGLNVVIRRLCQEAAATLPDDAAARRARVLAQFAQTFVFYADADPAGPASEEALEIAERCGDIAAIVAALRARQVLSAAPEGLEERERLAARLLALSGSVADPTMELSARLWRIDTSLERGDLDRVAAEIELLRPCVEEVRGPVARFHLLACRAVLAQAQARFADALRLEAEAFGVLHPTRHLHPFHVRAGLASAVGRHIGQNERLLAAAGFAGAPEGTLEAGGLISAMNLAHALVTAGRRDEALDVYRAQGPVNSWRPPPHVVLLSYALGIAVAVALGQVDDLPLLRQRLAPYRGHHVVSGTTAVVYLGPVELWLGMAARHLGSVEEAVEDLTHAVQVTGVKGAVAFQVEAQYELAAALADRSTGDDIERARSLVATARRSAAALRMAPIAGHIDRVAARLEASRERTPLTRREREVAELVAQGLTNREIAERLFTSDRTAQNHVQHILRKLGLSNRSQIAIWMNASKKMST